MNTLKLLKSFAIPLTVLLALSACLVQPVAAPQTQTPAPPTAQATLQDSTQGATPLAESTAIPGTPAAATLQPTPAPAQGNTQVSASGSVKISKCTVSSPTSHAYTVTVCFSDPANNSVLSGDATITAALTASGNSTGVQRF